MDRLDAEARFRTRVDLPDRLNPIPAQLIKDLLRKLDPFNVQNRIVRKTPELAHLTERGIFCSPDTVQFPDRLVFLLHSPHELRPSGSGQHSRSRFIEQLIPERFYAMLFHHPRTVTPHIKIELTTDRMQHVIRHEMSVQERLFRNRPVPLRIESAVMPSGTGVIHIQRQPRINGTPVLIRRIRRPMPLPVLAHPSGRRKRSDGIKPDPLGSFIVKNILVQPFQGLRVSECRTRNAVWRSLIKNHPHQITRFPVHLEHPLRADRGHGIFRHPERSGKDRKHRFPRAFRISGEHSGNTAHSNTQTLPQIHFETP